MPRPSVIHKDLTALPVRPILLDYPRACREFSWDSVRQGLRGLPGGGLNIAYEAADRHATGVRAGRAAFRFVSNDGVARELSYAQLSSLSHFFCSVLRRLGVAKGERLFLLCGRIPELYVALLGALKNGTVVSPLFSAFGPDPIATRSNLGSGPDGALTVENVEQAARVVAPVAAGSALVSRHFSFATTYRRKPVCRCLLTPPTKRDSGLRRNDGETCDSFGLRALHLSLP